MAQTDTTHAERLLLPYLLRLLPDDQAEQVELATLSDDQVAERLKVVEHDLVDGYIRDTLDAATRDRFESYYLSSPIRRERVRFAAEFLRAVDGAAAASRQAPAAGAVIVPPRANRHWRLLAAAAALVLASGTLMLVLTDRPRNSGPGVGAPPIHSEPPTPLPPSSSIALVLLPQTRAVSEPPALRVEPGVSRVRFELRLESDDYPGYQAGLRDPRTNATLWRSTWTTPAARPGRSAVEVEVPAALLKAQHYSLDLSGRTGTGAVHVVGSYAFSVTPP
jgi:hypothetical protein